MKIQACATGYAGSAASVFALLDSETGVLAIGKVMDLRRARFADSAIVSNTEVPEHDSWFTDEDMPAAVASYQRRVAEQRITFGDGTQRANPGTALQVKKVEADGRKYELNEEFSNAQLATLMLCWHADRAQTIEQAFAFGDELQRLAAGNLITI